MGTKKKTNGAWERSEIPMKFQPENFKERYHFHERRTIGKDNNWAVLKKHDRIVRNGFTRRGTGTGVLLLWIRRCAFKFIKKREILGLFRVWACDNIINPLITLCTYSKRFWYLLSTHRRHITRDILRPEWAIFTAYLNVYLWSWDVETCPSYVVILQS
jgi:hypothetical protein